jgi:outer membrane protein
MNKLKILFAIVFVFIFTNINAFSQKVAFISSDQIRTLFVEAKQADQRLQTIVEEWKRELKEIDMQIEAKQFEIQKNRLVWTEQEKIMNSAELDRLKETRMDFAKQKYSVGAEYDAIVKTIMKPVEDKIFAAVQKVAAEEGFDIVLDKTNQALPYVNFKYDLTVKVLKELGVDTEQLEKEQQDKIQKDPRNQQTKSKDTPTKKTRKRKSDTTIDDTKDEEKKLDVAPKETKSANTSNEIEKAKKIEEEKK